MTDLIINSFIMYGLVIVISFLAACLIKAIVTVLAKAEDRKKAKFKVTKATTTGSAAASGIPPDHIAAISAAVYAMLGSHRIVHISDQARGTSWSLEGKLLHQSSHNVHRSNR